jgi:hypothetical protein
MGERSETQGKSSDCAKTLINNIMENTSPCVLLEQILMYFVISIECGTVSHIEKCLNPFLPTQEKKYLKNITILILKIN